MTGIEELRTKIEELERAEYTTLQQMKQYKETHLSEFFKPFPHQQRIIDFIEAGKKTIVLHGANRCGKTVLGANCVCSFALRYYPWNKKESIFGGRPTRGRVICSDWEHHAREVIVPALKEWIPADTYETQKNNVGIEAYWQFKNGSHIEFLTHTQETRYHEGWKGNWVWSDEILPREKYTANKRGLVDDNGIFLITLTEVEEGWVLDDLILSNDISIGYVIDVPMRANTTLSEEAIVNFERACTEEEKEARVYGRLVRLAGRICKEFDRGKHIITPFQIMHDWPVVAGIDWHPAKEQAIGFYATDPNGINYVIDEIWEHLSPEEIADRIIRRKERNQWRLNEVFIDPLASGDKNRNVQTSYTIIENILARSGIRLNVASKDKANGIRNIRTWLLGPNKMPSLYIFSTCDRHIYEIQRWKWDEGGHAAKEHDDMMENLYRFTLIGNKYRPLSSGVMRMRNYAYA